MYRALNIPSDMMRAASPQNTLRTRSLRHPRTRRHRRSSRRRSLPAADFGTRLRRPARHSAHRTVGSGGHVRTRAQCLGADGPGQGLAGTLRTDPVAGHGLPRRGPPPRSAAPVGSTLRIPPSAAPAAPRRHFGHRQHRGAARAIPVPMTARPGYRGTRPRTGRAGRVSPLQRVMSITARRASAQNVAGGRSHHES